MSLWTVQQHEWLHALGHPVMLLAGDPSLAAAPTSAPESTGKTDTQATQSPKAIHAQTPAPQRQAPASRPPPADERSSAPLARRAAPVNAVAAPSTPTADTEASLPRADAAAKKAALEAARGARRASRPVLASLPADDPLVQAIARASGLEPDAWDAAARIWQIDLAQLRAEPSSKRALWHVIRGARRSARR